MLASYKHGQYIPLTAGQDEAACGNFGYFFADAPEAPFHDFTLAALEALHRDMVEPDADPEGDHASLPPIFAYFGQFVDHDITATSPAPSGDTLLPIDNVALAPVARADVVRSLLNARTGQFDLDSLYGASDATGNDALDKLNSLLRFPQDRAKMWIGTFGDLDRRPPFPKDPAGDLLRLERVLSSGLFTEADIDALPDTHKGLFRRKDGTLNLSRAIIGDARNDENLFVAQVHLAFLRFHNRVVDAWPHPRRSGDADEVFDWAGTQVRRYYQWLVLNVWLPGICDPKIVRSILSDGPKLYDEFLTNCNWAPGDHLPVPMEFASACFRFGHSMVRGSYDWNANFGRGDDPLVPQADFIEFFNFTGSSPVPMRGFSTRLPANWGADWDRLAHPISTFGDRSVRLIDTRLADPLTNMVNEDNTPISRNLLARNLRRGVQHNLPTAQSVIAGLNALGIAVPVLTKAQIASGNTATEVIAHSFDEHTPLWFYTLKEAEILGRGQRLGPVGSHIVAGTIIGLIQRGPDPVWQAGGSHEGRWHPVDGPRVSGQLVDSFPALLRAALLMENPDV